MLQAETWVPRHGWNAGLAVWALFCVAGLLGCGDFEAKYDYLGPRRLSDQPMAVKTVFWPDHEPVVFATHREGSERRTMHLLPISGREGCQTGPLTRFAAVADDRGFRLALLDAEEHRLRFYDSSCQVLEPVLDDVEGMGLRTAGGVHRFLVQTRTRELLSVDPYLGTETLLARGVERVGSGLVRLPGQDAVWVVTTAGLSVVDLGGDAVTESLADVVAFAQYLKPTVRGGMLVATQDVAGDITLSDWDEVVFSGAPLADREVRWSQQDACGPRLDSVLDGCRGECQGVSALDFNDPSETELRGGDGLWVSMYSPCSEERRVVVRRADLPEDRDEDAEPPPAIEVAAGVRSYRLLGHAVAGRPMVAYRQETEDGRADFFVLAGEPPIPFGTEVDLDSISVLVAGVAGSEAQLPAALAATHLRLVTADGRWGTWNAEDGFQPQLDGVQYISGQGLVLHGFDDDRGAGTLSFCLLDRCARLAEGVPDDAFYAYETVERITEGRPMFAFLRDYSPERGAGTLTVIDRISGVSKDVVDNVRTFAPIELGSARGLVYSIPDGPDRGLWYSAR